MNRLTKIGSLSVAILMLGACATTPPGPPPEVVRLQNELDRAHNDPRIAPNAPNELRDADTLVSSLAANGRQLEVHDYQHRVYIAERLIQTAEAEGLARFAEVRARDLGTERDRLVADSRTRQLRTARMAVVDAQAQTLAAQQDAVAARSENEVLRADLSNLQAQQTQRGFVVTLGDVLFEVDRAELKPGAARTLDQLATALNDDRRSTISIEGHTDSTGSAQHNESLSLNRAESVKAYLVRRGVDPVRVTTQGLGQDYPVASNSTEAGRQQNRRVEVIVQTNVAQR